MIAQRHELIYLNPATEYIIHSCHTEAMVRARINDWLTRGLPFIYPRQRFNPQQIFLGLPFKIDNKKYRVSLSVDKSAVYKILPLPTLITMQDFFLKFYSVEIQSYLADFSKKYPHFLMNNIAVYGSFLFHYLSGLDPLDENSDLDLLINYSGYALIILQELIIGLAQRFNRAIDGELRFASQGDISFRELFNNQTEHLLCKKNDTIELISKARLYEHYPALFSN